MSDDPNARHFEGTTFETLIGPDERKRLVEVEQHMALIQDKLCYLERDCRRVDKLILPIVLWIIGLSCLLLIFHLEAMAHWRFQ